MDPVIIALGLGAVLFFLSKKKKKNGNGNGNGKPDDGAPRGDEVKPTDDGLTPTKGGKKNAPTPFPYTNTAVINAEQLHLIAYHAEWMGAMSEAMIANGNEGGKPTQKDFFLAKKIEDIPGQEAGSGRSPASWYTDKVMYKIFPKMGKTWPAPEKQGTGWKKYNDSWARTYDDLKGKQWMNRPK